MPGPYLLMTALFGTLAVLAAIDTALTSLGLVPFFSGLRWLRVHLVTLGMLAETFVGLLPVLVASRTGRPCPASRWDIWLALNSGLLTLLIGIPLVNGALILVGGTFVFIAAALLVLQLRALRDRRARPAEADEGSSGRRFYLAALGFLLVGIVIGTGLWNGWAGPLRIAIPLEAHIHANSFGFLALTFAGLLVDLHPDFTGRPLARPRFIGPVFWLMTSGALLLVLAPWSGVMMLNVPGVLLHLAGTAWLLANVVKPALGDRRARTPGLLHLTTAYLWFLAPIVVAPLVIFSLVGTPAEVLEQSAPQALIFGWAAQVGYALLPYLVARGLLPDRPARLGGTWLSLAAANLGALAIWASMLIAPYQASLYALAYLLWTAALLQIVAQIWHIVAGGPARLESENRSGPRSGTGIGPA